MKATYLLLLRGSWLFFLLQSSVSCWTWLYTVSNCDNFLLFFCLPLQSSFMIEHEHVYLPSYVTQYIQWWYCILSDISCIKVMFMSISVWVWLLHNKVCFLCRSVQMAMEGTCRLQLLRGGWKVMCQRKRERDDEKWYISPLIILLVKCHMHIPLSCPFVWLHLWILK